MRTLVCGDLHTKISILNQIETLVSFYDKIVFLGDYVDEWDTIPDASYNLLWELIDFKRKFPNVVVLLLGNHDISEWQPPFSRFYCSGWNERVHSLVKDVYEKNMDLFQIAYAQDGYLFTHAGVTSTWAKDCKLDLKTAEEWEDTLNDMLRNKRFNENHFNRLASAGFVRGGIGSPSPIWADRQELISRPVAGIGQIVGHTPQKTVNRHIIKNGDGTTHDLWFCDTHSLMPNKRPIGDNSLLEIADGRIRATQLMLSNQA